MIELLYFETSFVGALVLLFIIIGLRKNRTDTFMKDQQIFEIMLIFSIFIILCDGISSLFEKNLTRVSFVLNSFAYAFLPCVSFIYFLYCVCKLNIQSKHLKESRLIFYIGIGVQIIMVVLGFFFEKGTYFYVDIIDGYMRGPLYFISFCISYGLYLYIIIYLLLYLHRNKNKKNIIQDNFLKHLILFPLPFVIGSIIQIIFVDAPILYVSMIFSLLAIYINIQSVQISYDPLTGIYNRRQLIPFLNYKIKKKEVNNIYIVIIDINGFKKINDTLGHIVGDEALVDTATIFKNNVKKEDFLGRYGGDEFIIICERKNEYEILSMLENIKNDAIKYNKNSDKEYLLSFSVGYTKCIGEFSRIEEFIEKADANMYIDKAKKPLDSIKKSKG